MRSIGVTLGNLQPDKEYQLDLFDQLIRKEKLSQAIDQIYARYGRLAIFRGQSLKKASQLSERAGKIGGIISEEQQTNYGIKFLLNEMSASTIGFSDIEIWV